MTTSPTSTKGTRVSLLLKWGRELLDELGLPNRADLDARIALVTTRLEAFMADVSPVLNTLAEDLRAFGEGPFKALVDENAQLKVDKATLLELIDSEAARVAAEDVAEESAAQRAVDEFNRIARPVTESPDVPVEIPDVEVPVDPEPSPDLPTEPAPAEPGEQGTVEPGTGENTTV